MKTDNHSNIVRTCPKCGRLYTGYPAISRIDNSTPICSDCGTREALESIGISVEEQEQIINTIHSHTVESRS